MKVKTRLYGLRQSPKKMFGATDHHLEQIGSHPLKSDLCIQIFEHETGSVVVTLNVNAVFVLSENEQMLTQLQNSLWTISR